MAGIELGVGFVSIVPETRGFEKKLTAAMASASRGAKLTPEIDVKGVEQQGRSASQRLHTAFQSDARRRSDALGRSIGDTLGKGMAAGITAAAVGVTAAVGGIGLALNKGLDRYRSLDATAKRLGAMGKSATEVRNIMADINSVVEGTPIALDAASQSAVQFLQGGVQEGKQLKDVLTAIADASGASGTEFGDLALIFGQVMNKGKLQAEEMLQLNERNIGIQSALRKEFGWTGEELSSLARDGKITFDQLVQAVEGSFGGMSKRAGDSIDGALSNMQASVGRAGANLLSTIFGDPLSATDGPGAMAESINTVTEKLDGLSVWIKDHGPEITNSIQGIGSAFLDVGSGALEMYKLLIEGQRAMTLGVAYTSIGDARKNAFADAESMAETIRGIDEEISKNDERKKSWEETQQASAKAAEFVEDLHGAIAERAGDAVVLKAPSAEDLNKISEAKYRIEQIPGTQDFTVVPRTEEATTALNAWRDKQKSDPATVPAEANTKPAEQQLGAWRTDEQGRPVRIPAEVLLEKAQADLDAFVANAPKSISMLLQLNTGMTPTGSAPGGGAADSNPLDAFAPTRSNPTNANTGGALTPETQAVQDYLRNDLGFTGIIGGWRQDKDFPNEHPAGKASDVMIRSKDEGYALLPNLLRQPGVQYILWDNKQWNPDGTSSSGISSPHTDHLHVKTYDQGGWLPPGATLAQNKTGKPEYILTPEQIEELRKQGIDPATIQHGTANGAPPGPTPEQLEAVQEPAQAGRTEGYIPGGAGFTGKTGGGVAGSFISLGAEALKGVVDMAADAAKMAASAAATAGTFGAGAAAGPASGMGIDILAGMGKRGIDYGAEMANIGIGAVTEIAMPFGAPRWLNDVDPTSFMPQFNITPAATTTSEAAIQAIQEQNSPVDPLTTQHGTGAGSPPGPVAPMVPEPPAGANVLSTVAKEAANWAAPTNTGNGATYNVYATDLDGALRGLKSRERLNAMQYSGRP